jgi:SAM-dependent methyltransferase
MREAGERLLKDYARFVSVDGAAEQTSLPDRCADFIAVGQAFHWFERVKTRREFERILKPGGWVVLVWNDRRTDSTPFLRAYEDLLLRYSTDYEKVNHKQVDERALRDFYGGDSFKLRCFDNQQIFDYEGLKGRLLSSSYAPGAGHPDHAPMIGRLAEIFEDFQAGGRVVFEYDTTLYYGRLVA